MYLIYLNTIIIFFFIFFSQQETFSGKVNISARQYSWPDSTGLKQEGIRTLILLHYARNSS